MTAAAPAMKFSTLDIMAIRLTLRGNKAPETISQE